MTLPRGCARPRTHHLAASVGRSGGPLLRKVAAVRIVRSWAGVRADARLASVSNADLSDKPFDRLDERARLIVSGAEGLPTGNPRVVHQRRRDPADTLR